MLILTVIVRLRFYGREIIRLCVRVSQRMPESRNARRMVPFARRLASWALWRGRAPPT